MTERGQRHLQRDARNFRVGPSQMTWNGQSLTLDLDERGAPLPRRVLGRVRVHPLGLSRFRAALDPGAHHHWGPIAPSARIEVDLALPGLRWQGHAYVDGNDGDEPLERGFRRWDWLRAPLPGGDCAVVYDTLPREGPARLIGRRFHADGSDEPFVPEAGHALPRTALWRIDRRVLADADGEPARVRQTLEDTPFYARSILQLPLCGQSLAAVHETLDVRRLQSPVVQRLLPFRMPRRR
jgi:carotenoid 1,2-hydratase